MTTRTKSPEAPTFEVGARVVLARCGGNNNGKAGVVERVAPHTVWVRYEQNGRVWVSPLRPWQVEAPRRAAYQRPAVMSVAVTAGAAAWMRLELGRGR